MFFDVIAITTCMIETIEQIKNNKYRESSAGIQNGIQYPFYI